MGCVVVIVVVGWRMRSRFCSFFLANTSCSLAEAVCTYTSEKCLRSNLETPLLLLVQMALSPRIVSSSSWPRASTLLRACATRKTTQKRCTLEKWPRSTGNIAFAKASLDVDGSYDDAFEGADAVIHTAARVHEQWSVALLDSHIQGTTRVVDSAKK